VVREEGDYLGAHARFEEALAISREKGETEKASLFLGKLAELEVLLDRLDEAQAHAREVVEAARALHLPDRIVDPLRTLATIARRRGDAEEALTLLDEAAGPAREIGNDFLLTGVARERGLVLLELGDLDAAETALIVAEEHARAAEAGDALGQAIFARAQVAVARGDLDTARALAAEAVDVLGNASAAQAQEVTAWQNEVLGQPG
jgi:ATP/maltotriose-dependent transcriptional regulator MalT